MARFPVLLNYDRSQVVGWVELDVHDGLLLDCALVPGSIKGPDDEVFKVENFGLVMRSTVDTRLRDHTTGEFKTE